MEKATIFYELNLKLIKDLSEELHEMCFHDNFIWPDIQKKESELHEAIRNLFGLDIKINL